MRSRGLRIENTPILPSKPQSEPGLPWRLLSHPRELHLLPPQLQQQPWSRHIAPAESDGSEIMAAGRKKLSTLTLCQVSPPLVALRTVRDISPREKLHIGSRMRTQKTVYMKGAQQKCSLASGGWVMRAAAQDIIAGSVEKFTVASTEAQNSRFWDHCPTVSKKIRHRI